MKIISFILAITFVCSSIALYAQKNELNSAKATYDKYSQLRGTGTPGKFASTTLKGAKESIDKAAVNEKTMADPMTWTYKAMIYADLALLDTVASSSAPLVAEALSAQVKATELDKDGANKANIATVSSLLGQYYFDKGVREYGKNKFADASSSFENGLKYLPNDTTVLYYTGLAYINAKNYDKAISKYNDLTKTKFSELGQVYLDLSKMYAITKDTVNAIRVASEGAVKFPAMSDLATQEIELSMMTGKQKEIIAKINSMITKEPKNKLYPFYLGIAYDGINDAAKSEEAYKAAIAIDPNFEEGYINLGALILNNGIEIYNKTNSLPPNQQAQYTEGMVKANAEFDRALPYLEKIIQLNPKSRLGYTSLRQYYLAKRNTAKAEEVKKLLESGDLK